MAFTWPMSNAPARRGGAFGETGEGAEEWMHFLIVGPLHSVNRWEY